MTYTITKNPTFGSVEISFSEKPAAAVRDALKALRFRWHKKNSVWYGYTSEEAARAAVAGAMDGTAAEDAPAETDASSAAQTPKTNDHGVQLYDVFRMTWGYEQTNVDFFQVIEIVGKTSVRVRQVNPPMVGERGISYMSSERTYRIAREALPVTGSIFIKDATRGDLKRTKQHPGGGVSINIDGHNANLVQPGDLTVFESWYG